jgi:hypothetical protein
MKQNKINRNKIKQNAAVAKLESSTILVQNSNGHFANQFHPTLICTIYSLMIHLNIIFPS